MLPRSVSEMQQSIHLIPTTASVKKLRICVMIVRVFGGGEVGYLELGAESLRAAQWYQWFCAAQKYGVCQ